MCAKHKYGFRFVEKFKLLCIALVSLCMRKHGVPDCAVCVCTSCAGAAVFPGSDRRRDTRVSETTTLSDPLLPIGRGEPLELPRAEVRGGRQCSPQDMQGVPGKLREKT